jgi:hypothetical protein
MRIHRCFELGSKRCLAGDASVSRGNTAVFEWEAAGVRILS